MRAKFLCASICALSLWTATALSVTGVTATQRYPWNGLFDVVVALSGSADEIAQAEYAFAATNVATGAAKTTAHLTPNGTPTGSGTAWVQKFIWDGTADVGAWKIDQVDLFVEALDAVQLWEGGPYWATCNVGAAKPEAYGFYFWWGDTVGYTYDDGTWVSSAGVRQSSSPFDSSCCPTYNLYNSELELKGYIDSTGDLAAKHDAATQHLGAPWRMPTEVENEGLYYRCTTTWTTRNGVYGRLVTGKGAFSSRSIFLPAAGFGYQSGRYNLGSYGRYWFSTPDPDSPRLSSMLYFHSSYFHWGDEFRCYGMSVRPVRSSAVVFPGVACRLTMDCRKGTRVAAATEKIAYSTDWASAVEEAVAEVAVNGSVISAQPGTGTVEWTPTQDGTYTLTHTVKVDGVQVGEALSATFVVKGVVAVAETQTTDVPVPYAWLRETFPSMGTMAADYEAKAKGTAANGRQVWECFVAGEDPTDAASCFAAQIDMADGKPIVRWLPDLGTARTYTVYGAVELEGEWTDVSALDAEVRKAYRFFKVTVEMPRQ